LGDAWRIWQSTTENLALGYLYIGLCAGSPQLVGILHPDPVQLTQLIGYESQQDALLKIQSFLLAGYPALHVLLYGSRGSGKSSCEGVVT